MRLVNDGGESLMLLMHSALATGRRGCERGKAGEDDRRWNDAGEGKVGDGDEREGEERGEAV